MIPSRSPRARGPCRSREGAYRTFTTHRSHIAPTQTACNSSNHAQSTYTHSPHIFFQSAQAASPRSPAPSPSRRSRLRHCPPPNRLWGAGLVLSLSVLSLRVCLDPLPALALMLWQATWSVQSVGKNKNMRGAARHVVRLFVGSVFVAQWRRGAATAVVSESRRHEKTYRSLLL